MKKKEEATLRQVVDVVWNVRSKLRRKKRKGSGSSCMVRNFPRWTLKKRGKEHWTKKNFEVIVKCRGWSQDSSS